MKNLTSATSKIILSNAARKLAAVIQANYQTPHSFLFNELEKDALDFNSFCYLTALGMEGSINIFKEHVVFKTMKQQSKRIVELSKRNWITWN